MMGMCADCAKWQPGAGGWTDHAEFKDQGLCEEITEHHADGGQPVMPFGDGIKGEGVTTHRRFGCILFLAKYTVPVRWKTGKMIIGPGGRKMRLPE